MTIYRNKKLSFRSKLCFEDFCSVQNDVFRKRVKFISPILFKIFLVHLVLKMKDTT
jgi:hypothetical protein